MHFCTAFFWLGLALLAATSATAQPFTYTFIESDFSTVNYGSLAFADINRDGEMDLVVGGNESRFAPFLPTSFIAMSQGETATNGENTINWQHSYEEKPLPTAVWHNAVAWNDYDGDGDLDFILTGTTSPEQPFDAVSTLYRNDGTGQFQATEAGLAGVYGGDTAWGDFDNDGDPDLLISGSTASDEPLTRLYRNDGGVFAAIETTFPDLAFGDAEWADYDGDGDLDVLLSGADPTGNFITTLYRNDEGSFQPANVSLPGLAFTSLDWGDYDDDGDLDLLMSGGELSPLILEGLTKLFRNDGGSFTEIPTNLPGILYGSSIWGDYDNDGDLDIMLVGGRAVLGTRLSRIYRNQNGAFQYAITLASASVASAHWADYDDDGDLDALISGISANAAPMVNLYRSDQTAVNTAPTRPDGLQAEVDGRNVTLSWNAAADEQTDARGLSYNIRVGTSSGSADVASPLSSDNTGYRWVPGRGNVDGNTRWTLRDLAPGVYQWSVQAIDHSFKGSPFAAEGTFTIGSSGGGVGTDAEDEVTIPRRVALHPGFPNPFRERSIIGYDLPEATPVTLKIYNVLGAEVRTLVDATQPGGRHEIVWDGRDNAGRQISAGMYFVRMQAGSILKSQPIILM